MTKKIAVILSGCGVFDGSEIHETVMTLYNLSKAGFTYQCMAPNISQTKVINHLTREDMSEKRNVLIESARLARGDIIDIEKANSDDYSGAIFPGGFGAASNLSDFANLGQACHMNSAVLVFAKQMAKAKKPMGFICIAPHLIPLIYGKGVKLTIGTDAKTAETLNHMGGIHIHSNVEAIVVDEEHRVISTPAYMLGKNPLEISIGIEKLVEQIKRFIE